MAKQGNGNNEWKGRYEDLRQENEELQRELQDQQKVTNEVRQEAFAFLNEMKALSDRSGQSWEREEKLVQQVHRLEEEVSEWKSRYARTKTQLRTLRTTSMGMAIHPPDAGQYAKDGSLSRDDGLVKDVHVTKFQIAIDGVLRTARTGEPQGVIDSMKSVVAAVRDICQDITDSVSSDDELQQQRAKLRSNVSGTANNFITASKNYAQSNGVSPISLLDAAASHLAAAVVELVRTVKIRPTPAGELGDEDDAPLVNGSGAHQNHNAFNRRSSITESIYSSRTSGLPTSPPPLNRVPPRRQPAENSFTRDSPSRNGGAMPAKVPARDTEVDDLKVSILEPLTHETHSYMLHHHMTNTKLTPLPALPRRPNRVLGTPHPIPCQQHPHHRQPRHRRSQNRLHCHHNHSSRQGNPRCHRHLTKPASRRTSRARGEEPGELQGQVAGGGG